MNECLAQPANVRANIRACRGLQDKIGPAGGRIFNQNEKIVSTMHDREPQTIHASCVAIGGRGVVILGASGAGKSSLALSMMALGAGLVADDRTRIERRGAVLIADCPEAIRGRIEARRVGILSASPTGPVELALAVDLDRPEPDRLPPFRTIGLLGVQLPLVLGQGHGHLAPVLRQYLLAGRWDRDEA